jgi:hypothetical protein
MPGSQFSDGFSHSAHGAVLSVLGWYEDRQFIYLCLFGNGIRDLWDLQF